MEIDQKKETVKNLRKEMGIRLREQIKGLAVRPTTLARSLAMPPETLRAYLAGRAEPPILFFQKFINSYPTIDVGYIITGKRDLEKMKEDFPLLQIPVVDSVPPEGFPNGIPAELIINETFTTNLVYPNIFGFRVHGSGYLPEAKDGDVLIVAPLQDFENEKLHAFYTTGSSVYELAQVFKAKNNTYRVVPVQPEARSHTVTRDEVLFIGRVIETDRKFT